MRGHGRVSWERVSQGKGGSQGKSNSIVLTAGANSSNEEKGDWKEATECSRDFLGASGTESPGLRTKRV